MRRTAFTILLLGIALVAASCSDDTPSVATTTTIVGVETPEGIIFGIDEGDNGARLRIRIGDDIRARLLVDENDDPAWRASISNPGVLTAGDRLRFAPSDFSDALPYDEYMFRAVRIGGSDITFDHPDGPRTLTVTVVVYQP